MTGRIVTGRRWVVVVVVMSIVLVLCAAAALRIGGAEATEQIVVGIRAPRVVMAILVGAGLAVAGVLLQGSLANPLADPALVGVSAGAAVGAAAGAAIGIAYNSFLLAAIAVATAVIAVVIGVRAATRAGRPEVVTLLLAGVAITAFASALLGVVVSLGDQPGARSITFWTTGSLALSTWSGVVATGPFVAAGLLIAATMTRSLDILALGDQAAATIGVPVARVRATALVAVALLVAAGVCVVGVIAFIGLLVPHAMRGIAGPGHGRLVISSAICGALVVLIADTIARTVAFPMEIPIGVVCALFGAPAFFVLLVRTRRSQGGWA